MANELGDKGKIYKTQLGNFTQEQGSIYVSDTVRREDFVIPAEFSKTGAEIDLRSVLNRNTVVYTEQDALTGAKFEVEAGEDSRKMSTAYLNSISLTTVFANATTMYGQDALGLARFAMSNSDRGPSAIRTNERGGGFLQITTQDPAEYLAEFVGVDLKNLNVTEGQIKAWIPSVMAHEAYHLKDDRPREGSHLPLEIEADFGSLRDQFNAEYKTFITDTQALTSLNNIGERDDHATHIWAEEYKIDAITKKPVMPTLDEIDKIELAPASIKAVMQERISAAWPEASKGMIGSIIDVPAQKYGALKVLREQGAFDEIPFGNEFVDKYISAAERLYTPEYRAESNIDKFKELLNPAGANPPAMQNAATVQPVMAPAAPGA